MATSKPSLTPEDIKKRAQWRYGAWWFAAALLILVLIIDLRLMLFRPGVGSNVVAKSVVGGVLVLVIATCILLATHNERIANGTIAPRGGEFAPLTAERRRSRSAIIGWVASTVLLGAGIAIFVMALEQHARSDETQRHGILVNSTVLTVEDGTHCVNYVCTNTPDFIVRLHRPVEGRTTTTVHDPDDDPADLTYRNNLPILVDPQEPSYAELPGKPLVEAGLLTGATLFFGFTVIAFGAAVVDQIRAHRRQP
ncbi:MAG TPA: hypothetical protein VFE19_05135 [Jatrophihabitantaceae bacterium]|jgi:hypothetical protein|nr:hypothetical protein [Jatrophihabitantaceae bacterium]